MPYTARNLIQEAFEDLGVLAPSDTLDDTDADIGLKKLVRVFDDWNAERAGVYANRLTTYTLVPALNPHTIGPAASTPTFTVTQRPVTIDGANLVISGVRSPLTLLDTHGWAGLTLPALSTSMPSALHYEADWPLGKIYLYPVPSAAYGLELLTRIVLADLGLDDTVSLPPGYRSAVILTLEELLAPSYPPAEAPTIAAAQARARIYANNDEPRRLATVDSGMPGQRGGRWFDVRAGTWQP